LLAGFINLARSDGLLWLPLTLLVVPLLFQRRVQAETPWKRLLIPLLASLLAFGGYLSVFGPWVMRNLHVFGTLIPPGSAHVFWMTSYNQIFSYTPETYTFNTWLAQGWKVIISTRLSALWQNMGTAVMAQGSIFLFPLVLVGAWKYRKLPAVQLGIGGWLILLLAESFLFPYASVRGGFFHAGAVFQPLWFVLAPLGLEAILDAIARVRRKPSLESLVKPTKTRASIFHTFPTALPKVFMAGYVKRFLELSLVVIAIALSVMLVKIRVLDSGWNEGEYRYLQAEKILVEQGANEGGIVMTTNPPAYNAMTGRQAIVIPAGDVQTLLAAARYFNATYVVLERDRLLESLADLFEHPENHPGFRDIGGFGDVRILVIE
jgi:hypothetical protein